MKVSASEDRRRVENLKTEGISIRGLPRFSICDKRSAAQEEIAQQSPTDSKMPTEYTSPIRSSSGASYYREKQS